MLHVSSVDLWVILFIECGTNCLECTSATECTRWNPRYDYVSPGKFNSAVVVDGECKLPGTRPALYGACGGKSVVVLCHIGVKLVLFMKQD